MEKGVGKKRKRKGRREGEWERGRKREGGENMNRTI